MKLKVIHKLFLALLLSTSCALITMAWLAQRSLDRGFVEYINQRETERLNTLIAKLETEYQNHGWQRISPGNDKDKVWRDLIGDSGRGRPRRRGEPRHEHPGEPRHEHPGEPRHEHPGEPRHEHPGEPRHEHPGEPRHEHPGEPRYERRGEPRHDRPRHDDDSPPRQHRNDDRERDRHREGRRPPPDGHEPNHRRRRPPPDGRPPPPPPRRGDDPFNIGPRIALFDANRQRIIGRADFTELAIPKPIYVEGSTVGWIGIKPLKNVTASSDIDFLSEQSRSLFLFACALIILVALLAIFLARHLVRPIRNLTQASQHLAAGDYETRVSVIGHDEIAELARDFNTLAHTLEDNQQARQRWVADISHELRTPLAVMRSELEALEDGIRVIDKAAIHSLHAEVLRINKLVHDLHELSLSDIGALTYKRAREDLRNILQHAVTAFEARFLRHELRLNYSPGILPELPINADRDRLLQLFSNLLENSIRYTDAGGEVSLTATIVDENVRIEIADSPPGVSPEECEKLFERLYRVESSRSRVGGGSGLGLAICKNIVDAHDGSIRAQPSTLDGLSVIIELPLDKIV